jgi:hypothetical protein
MPMWIVRVAMVLIAWCAMLGMAEAQTSDAAARARAHFEAGQTLVGERRFDDAYREFEAGYALSQRALFLFNMAECARESGRTSQARIDYARYLAADPDGSQVEVARERLAILGPEPVREPEPAQVAQVATPEEAAAMTTPAPEGALDTPLSDSAPPPGREIWEDWPFWTIVGSVLLAGAIAGTVVGVTTNSGPSCGMACVDLRM